MDDVREFLEGIGDMQVNALSVSKKLLEDGKENVTLELANRKVMPDRMESAPRAHTFHNAAGFVDYLNANKTKHLVVLIDMDQRIAEAVLDDRAEKGFERILFRPPYHPKFNLFRKHLLINATVKDFSQGVMLCRDLIAGVDSETEHAGRDLALLMKQITVSNEVTAEHGTGVDCVNGVMVKTNLRGWAETRVDMPETILIRTPIFLNTEPKQFELQVTVIPISAAAVRIQTNAPELPVIQHDLFEEMLVDVKGIDQAIVTYGTVGFGQWAYNR